MLLSSYLDTKLIYHEASPRTREEIYHEMVARICHLYTMPVSAAKLEELVLERDSESSTAYSTGLAIPHVRLDGFNDTLIAMCFLEHPTDYEGTPVSWIVLIITNRSSSKLYLSIVASLMKLAKNEETIRELRLIKEPGALISQVKRMMVTVKETLTIADLMITEPITISPDAKLRELGKIMNGRDIAVVPVVDEQMRYLGEVDVLKLLKVGIPDYMMMLDNLGFLGSFEPLENLFEKEDLISVREIMSREEEVLSPSASIIETVSVMIRHDKRLFSVVADGKLVGVISSMDVFKKVLRS